MTVSPVGRETLAENLRFQRCTDEDIEKLLNEKDSLSTKTATQGPLMCLQQYLFATNREVDLESYCSSELQLSAMLVNFYADARKKKGEHYKLSALKSIRFGLARHSSSNHGIDIIKELMRFYISTINDNEQKIYKKYKKEYSSARYTCQQQKKQNKL
jgi:hypothetical protein